MIRIKTARQIAGIRESCRMLADVLQQVEQRVEAGIATADLDRFARREIERLGGRPSFLGYHSGGLPPFPGALCISVNDHVIHGIPSDRLLRDGDIVGIDCGIDYEGYYSDSAITVSVGAVDSDAERLMRVTRQSLEDGIAAAVAGRRINDVSRAIYKRIHDNGFGVVRPFCGHGVGLAIHEDPQVCNYVGRGPNPRLRPGMVLAIEPMVNMGGDNVSILEDEWTVATDDGSLSAHFEHTVAIFPDHTEVLTRRANEVVHSDMEVSLV